MGHVLPRYGIAIGLAFVVVLVAACGAGAQATSSPTATPAPTVGPSPSPIPTATVAAVATSSPSAGPVGPANLDAPPEVAAGAQFEIAWTGPAAQGDYVTIVAAGAAKWTNESYFDTTGASPGKLVAPVKDGAYALWYVSGADSAILARRAIRVTPFQGSLDGPPTVEAGRQFQVAWTGPNGPSDYITIVAAGAAKWTDESYFYTATGPSGTLNAPVKAGPYELWYVTGLEASTQVRRPITVAEYVVTLTAPAEVARGAKFDVAWTGPNGPQDYITIAPAGSPVGTYLDYVYAANGTPVTLTAPDTAGAYEIRYASDRVSGTFKSIPIVVK